jgi:hypothetical protein
VSTATVSFLFQVSLPVQYTPLFICIRVVALLLLSQNIHIRFKFLLDNFAPNLLKSIESVVEPEQKHLA